MGFESKPAVVEQFENARVVEAGPTSYYVPNEIDDSSIRNVVSAHKKYADVVAFARDTESIRDPTSRAVYWARLQERVRSEGETFPLEYDGDIADIRAVTDITVPWSIALTGNKAVYAAYLATHGKPNSFLSEALEVSESSVSQYLSDVKAGRR